MGCRELVKGDGWCDAHRPEQFLGCADKNRKRKFTGRALQQLRESWFRHHPLCVQCAKDGRLAAARQLDHVIPLHLGGIDDVQNIQGLCKPCHDAKSQRELISKRRAHANDSHAGIR